MKNILEFYQKAGNDQDDDQRRCDKTDGGHDAPQVTCRFEACESGHIDADGTGRRLGNGDHIRDIRMAEPMGLVGHFIEEGKRSEPPADRKQSGFEKLEKKL